MLLNPPASHAIRLRLLTMLHEQLTRLNDEVKKSDDSSKRPLTLSDSELIIQALDEEFQFARGNFSVYQNVIKSRIMVLKKMKLAIWEAERIKKIAERLPKTTPRGPSTPTPIVTEMTPAEEIAFVPRLAAQQEGLNKHGYVTTMPTETELEAARNGVESAQGWEQCDRCNTRFQVFPGRREEDGALTSGGTCTYHWAKPRRPDVVKGENKPRELKYACCDEILGVSSGCTKADSHVFKTSDPKRLALAMPFETTPVSTLSGIPGAVCFDCEMGYSTLGMELIRLTATAWPDGKELLDVLVRPLGEVLDLNSRFSGVWPEDYANAVPYDQAFPHQQVTADDSTTRLQIVDSPFTARELLFKLLTLETPLIGHALENDLNAARILHPTIVDTALLFPHPRGLPLRFGLKVLMKRHLGRDIQMGGDQGHDSKEDARAAGDLVRFRVNEMWQKMRGEGWTKRDGEFFPGPAVW
ncbi:RNA exonuclease 3, variant 2 [Xanthoria calcicola]